jgi:Ca2+-binding RTX toxin-like protein
MARLALLATLALGAVLAAPAAASAATVGVVDGELRYIGETEKQISFSLSLNDAGEYEFYDEDATPDTEAGANCRKPQGGAYLIVCSRQGVERVRIALGRRNDSVSAGELPEPLSVSMGGGRDEFNYSFPKGAKAVNVTADGVADDGPAGRDNIGADVEVLRGWAFADTLAVTSPLGGELIGNQGDDRMTGGPGPDYIHAAYVEDVGTDSGSYYFYGTDTVACGGGRDFVLADRSDDIAADCEAVAKHVPGKGFEFRGSNTADRMSAPYGWDPTFMYGRGGADLLIGSLYSQATIYGGSGPDRIHGQGWSNRLYGDSGNDRIRARDKPAQRDIVRCGSGRDHAIVDRKDSVSGCERVSRG